MPKAQTSPEVRQFASIQEAARRCDVHPDTIRRRISSGQLTGYRLGGRIIRVDVAEVEALLRPIPTVKAR
jgi:excisionase family DNA binding protein